MPLTAIHITHEATEHMGGIGTVLEGLVTSPVYQRAVSRNIFVGTLAYPDRAVTDPLHRLGEHATACFYSGPEHHDPVGMGAILRPIEWAFDVKLVYGTRRFADRGDGHAGTGEVLLVDVSNPARDRLGAFKWFLHQKFHIDSLRYENDWSYEEWCRLAEPAYHALCALLAHPPANTGIAPTVGPAVLLSHEFMGMCTALRALEDRARFRCVFHAHECSTARRIVEALPGKDVAFYPAMRTAAAQGRFIADVFGDQHDFARHALICNTDKIDAVLAVGDETAEELRFLSPAMAKAPITTAYNGLPSPPLALAAKMESRRRVLAYLNTLLGFTPDYLITHVTRPVVSKGLWRDHKVCSALAPHLHKAGKRAVYLLLACGATPRSAADSHRMALGHNWPAQHTLGYPDLDGPEVDIHHTMQAMYAHAAQCINTPSQREGEGGGQIAPHAHTPSTAAAGGGQIAPHASPSTASAVFPITPLFINQFGFTREKLGTTGPDELSMADLRRAADVELGMSVYEPFGIAHLEALHAGAICIPSTVCGCVGLAKRALAELGMGLGDCPVLLPADFTSADVTDPLHFTAHQRDAVENEVCDKVAAELFRRLPTTDAARAKHLAIGQQLATKMGWDEVCERDILPVFERIVKQ
ncbi:MAG: hypothetical protein ACKVS8_05300 [Phycisphaerales bacterium]